jgi:NADH:ubiquinone oxidoreductase subunit E
MYLEICTSWGCQFHSNADIMEEVHTRHDSNTVSADSDKMLTYIAGMNV